MVVSPRKLAKHDEGYRVQLHLGVSLNGKRFYRNKNRLEENKKAGNWSLSATEINCLDRICKEDPLMEKRLWIRFMDGDEVTGGEFRWAPFRKRRFEAVLTKDEYLISP